MKKIYVCVCARSPLFYDFNSFRIIDMVGWTIIDIITVIGCERLMKADLMWVGSEL